MRINVRVGDGWWVGCVILDAEFWEMRRESWMVGWLVGCFERVEGWELFVSLAGVMFLWLEGSTRRFFERPAGGFFSKIAGAVELRYA